MVTLKRPAIRGLIALTGAALVLATTAGTATAAAPSAGAVGDSSVTVPQGAGTAPLDSGTPLGSTPADTQVRVSFILKTRNLSQLERQVENGWSGHFLSTGQFADKYGQTPSVVTGLQRYLQSFGINTQAYADRLDVTATGTAAQFNKALAVSLQNYSVSMPNASGHGSHRGTIHGSKHNPKLPKKVGDAVLAILGLSNYSPFSSNAVKAQGSRANAKPADTSSVPAGELLPKDFVNRYHLSTLEKGDAKGQGTTIGIVTLASIDPAVPLGFWNDILGLNSPASRLTLIPVDGGAGAPSAAAGTAETDLDVEQSGAIAPKAHVRVYEAPNTDPGFADAFFAAASDNVADTVSVSWGESETIVKEAVASGTETPAYIAAFDEAYLEFAAQGQSNFAASGDSGAYEATADAGTTNLDAGTPDDSPYITAAGGTTLPGAQTYHVRDASKTVIGTETVNIPAERAWSADYLWDLYKVLGLPNEEAAANAVVSGGTGGYSTAEKRPSYQRNISSFNDRQYLTPTNFVKQDSGLTLPTAFAFNPAPSLRSGYTGKGRGVPDLSTNADPQTGYAVYDPTLFKDSGGFAQYGGTSFVAPQLNGASAVIDSYLGHRVGFWNPKIYKSANSKHSPLTPLNDTTVFSGKKYLFQTDNAGKVTPLAGEFSNNNLFYTGKAHTTWNPATGLGVPDLTALAKSFGGRH
ncbi:MAG: S53 family peptidase [Nakamurella sp.]